MLYNAQHRTDGNYEREREYRVEGKEGETVPHANGIDISFSNDLILLANDKSSSFVLVKKTAEFAYAWTMPIPTAKGLMAFGNHREGKCSSNPFAQLTP